MVADEISGRYRIELREKELYLIGKGSIEGRDIILMEPLTFMNLSGKAVREVMKKYSISPENLIVVHDDIDMETGRLKIRDKGSSGGHKGIESIIEFLGAKEFVRVKIGIGREEGVLVEDYVLGKFGKEELPLIKDVVIRAADAVAAIVKDGAAKAMNKFN